MSVCNPRFGTRRAGTPGAHRRALPPSAAPHPRPFQENHIRHGRRYGIARRRGKRLSAGSDGPDVYSFSRGWASINVLARHAGAAVRVVDCGVAGDIPAEWQVIDGKIGRGTASIMKGPAMSRDEALRGILLGAGLVENAREREGFGLFGTGDMGIGNTTPSTAIICALSGKSPAQLTGRGTGIGDETLGKKVRPRDGPLSNRPDPQDPSRSLRSGGFEIAALPAACRAAAAGVPSSVTALSQPPALSLLPHRPLQRRLSFISHKSAEPGHIASAILSARNPYSTLTCVWGGDPIGPGHESRGRIRKRCWSSARRLPRRAIRIPGTEGIFCIPPRN